MMKPRRGSIAWALGMWALILCVSRPPAALAAGDSSPRWSYRYGAREIVLTEDEARAAVVLEEGTARDLGTLRRALTAAGGFLAPSSDDRAAYLGLWLPRFRAGLSPTLRLTAIERLAAEPGVEFAAPLLHYDQALVIPKPEILVALTSEAPSATLTKILAAGDLSVVRPLTSIQPTWQLALHGTTADVFDRARDLLALPGVVAAQPNFILELPLHNQPNDPLFSQQWNMNNTGQTGGTPGADLHAESGWDSTTGSPTITIAIVDEGVDVDHPDLAGNILPGHDSTNQPSPDGIPGNAAPGDPHGTACAGIAAAVGDNGIDVTGVSWSSHILPVRVGYGNYWTEGAWIVDAITWAADNGADVISNSWGGGPPSSLEENAIIYANTSGRGGLGCAVFFSSGNTNGPVSYPAAYSETIAVGATSPCDERKSPSSCDGQTWWGSNFGPELDLVAPGVFITTTDIAGPDGYVAGDTLSDFGGTSAACPHAAGAAALLLAEDSGLTAAEVESQLEMTAADLVGTPSEDTPGWDPYMGWGRIDLQALLTVSTPAPVAGLTCTPGPTSVLLEWSITGPSDSIEVARNGTVIATLSGSSTEYTDTEPVNGMNDYVVTTIAGGQSSTPALCSALVDLPVNTLFAGNAQAGPGQTGTQVVRATTELPTQGYSFGMLFDPTVLQVVDMSIDGTAASGADFFAPYWDNTAGYYTVGVVIDVSPPIADVLQPGNEQSILAVQFHVASNAAVGTVVPLQIPTEVGSPPVPPVFVQNDVSYSPDLVQSSFTVIPAIEMTITAGSASGAPGESGVSQFVLATNELPLAGFSYGLAVDPAVATIADVDLDGTATGDIGAGFFAPTIDPAGEWYTVGVVMDVSPPITATLPTGTDQPIVHALLDMAPGATVGATGALSFSADLGSPPVAVSFATPDGSVFTPAQAPGEIQVIPGASFLRADADGNGVLNLADPIQTLNYLFGSTALPCLDAADANDTGTLDLADPIYSLNYEFSGGPPPPAPYPAPGPDPTPDDLGCNSG